ncbi:MAG: glycerol kinase GlpK [Simkaniaceae bacterium]
MSFILAFDQGTTNSRSIIIDKNGQIVAEEETEFKQSFPKPGWIEQDPEEIWSSQWQTAQDVLNKSGIASKDITAIGITNQRETTILWDKETGQAVYPAIVWQDRRTSNYCGVLRSEGLEELFRERTGLLLDPYFSATKIIWILENVPGIKEKAAQGKIAFGTVNTWLLWKLTNGKRHYIDITNASRTLLFNIHKGIWDDELIEMLDIPFSIFPEVASNSEIYGETAAGLFSRPIPIASMIGDQQGALFGQACFAKGDVKCTYGTGGFILINTGGSPVPTRHHLLTTVAYQLGDSITYALEGSVFIAGAAVKWLRENMGIISSAAEVEALAKQVSSSEGVFFIPAFTGLGAPYWKPYARGMIAGLSRGSTKSHIARAALEGIAHQICDVFEAMQSDASLEIRRIKVDGGASQNNLLMQIQSDYLQIPLLRPNGKEFSAIGAGFLAGLATGLWKDSAEISQLWKLDNTFEPKKNPEAAKQERLHWHKAVNLAKQWNFE